MKKILFLLLFVIAAAALAFYFINSDDKRSLEEWEGSFAIENADDIARIVITDKKGKYINLVRNDDYWSLNDSLRADPNKIKNVLSALTDVQIHSIPPKEEYQYVAEFIDKAGTQVRVLDSGENILKSYFIAFSTNDGYGSYYLMEGSKQPYVMEPEKLVGSVSHMFTLSAEDYKDESYFLIDYEDISDVRVHYPQNNSESFHLYKISSGYEVKPLLPDAPKAHRALNETNVESYLREFNPKSAEGLIYEKNLEEKIRTTVPFLELAIEIEDAEDQKYTFIPYDRIHTEEDDPYKKKNKINRYYVLYGNEIMTVQEQTIMQIFRGYSYFFL